jgi:hypothetical protein
MALVGSVNPIAPTKPPPHCSPGCERLPSKLRVSSSDYQVPYFTFQIAVIVGWAMPTEWIAVRRRLPRSWRSREARADCAGSSSPTIHRTVIVGWAMPTEWITRCGPGVRTRRITVLHRIVVNVIEKRLKLARFVDRVLPEPPLPSSGIAVLAPRLRAHWWAVPTLRLLCRKAIHRVASSGEMDLHPSNPA